MADQSVQIIVPADASPELVSRLAEAFPDAGLAVAEAAPTYTGPNPLQTAAFALERIARAAPELPGMIAQWAQTHGVGLATLALIGLSIAASYGVERGLRFLLLGREKPAPAGDFRDRLVLAAIWLAQRLAFLAMFSLLATAIARAILPGEREVLELGGALLNAAMFVRAVLIVFQALTAPRAPQRRLMGFDDAEAAAVWRAAVAAMIATAFVRAASALLEASVGGSLAGEGVRMMLIVLGAAIGVWFFWRASAPVASKLSRYAKGGLAAFFAENWWVFYVLLTVADALLRLAGTMGLLGPEAAAGAGPTLMILILAPLVIAGVDVWRSEAQAQRRTALRTVAFGLLEAGVAVAAGLLLLRGWGIDPLNPTSGGAGSLAPRLVEATIIAVVSMTLWRAARAILDPGETPAEGALVDEENPTGGSRIGTILPVMRAFVLTVIAVIGGMSVLSALGVNIAPLLASAGVLGLAIGFGAQRLVTDVISGLFYLVEDAFRSGEYIVTGSGKGVVEKISLRSVRLRHHRGPVFTIPFSDIGTVQNHSRDWVKMKFTFQVPAGTDLEMVRKLVKKVGEKLLTVPELDGKFLEPLKSQGALAITGPSYTIGCKFTCKPGQQFTIRRFAYAALQDALLEKGVKLYAPQIMLADDGAPTPMATAPA